MLVILGLEYLLTLFSQCAILKVFKLSSYIGLCSCVFWLEACRWGNPKPRRALPLAFANRSPQRSPIDLQYPSLLSAGHDSKLDSTVCHRTCITTFYSISFYYISFVFPITRWILHVLKCSLHGSSQPQALVWRPLGPLNGYTHPQYVLARMLEPASYIALDRSNDNLTCICMCIITILGFQTWMAPFKGYLAVAAAVATFPSYKLIISRAHVPAPQLPDRASWEAHATVDWLGLSQAYPSTQPVHLNNNNKKKNNNPIDIWNIERAKK